MRIWMMYRSPYNMWPCMGKCSISWSNFLEISTDIRLGLYLVSLLQFGQDCPFRRYSCFASYTRLLAWKEPVFLGGLCTFPHTFRNTPPFMHGWNRQRCRSAVWAEVDGFRHYKVNNYIVDRSPTFLWRKNVQCSPGRLNTLVSRIHFADL